MCTASRGKRAGPSPPELLCSVGGGPSPAAASVQGWFVESDHETKWFVHNVTGETCWTLPPGAVVLPSSAVVADPQYLPRGWRREVGEDGAVWFAHDSGSVQWEPPTMQ